MKKQLVAMALLAAAVAPASAADLPTRKAPPAPPPPPAPTWTGFYVGLNAGGTWSDKGDISFLSAPVYGNPLFEGAWVAAVSAGGATSWLASNTNSGAGFIGGGQVGYNQQFNSFLVGFETDIQGVATGAASVSSATLAALGPSPGGNYFPGEIVATNIVGQRQIDYIGTARGRLGYVAMPTLLVYATGGLAYGGVSASASIVQGNNDCTIPVGGPGCLPALAFANGSASSTRVGWTAGGGVEWMFMPNWSAKIEYLYYDLGAYNFVLGPLVTGGGTIGAGPVTAVVASQASTRLNGNIVRAGVNYHFNWGAPAPVLAKF
jgi:outer membrane immunogenic protein